MINSIIFDIGKVLVDFNWEDYLKTFSFDKSTYAAIAEHIFLSPVWIECDLGILTDNELLLRFIQNAPEYEKEIRAVYAHIGRCVRQYDYALPWITSLKEKGCRVYALSNYGERMYNQTKEELNFLELMDGALISYREHLIKPDPRVYQTLLSRYKIKPDEAVFIDDNLDNVNGAADAGIHAIQFTGYEDALRQLRMLERV